MTYFAQLLLDSHHTVFEKLKPSLLQSYVQIFALAVYQKQFDKAFRIRSDALLFFPKDVLSALGMLDLISDIEIHGGYLAEKKAEKPSKIDHFQSIGDLGDLLQEKTLQYQSQWQDIFGYVVSFQSLAPISDEAWRTLPLEGHFKSAFTIKGKDIRTGEVQINKITAPKVLDPCQPAVGSDQLSISCQDIFSDGAGPMLRSVWLDHSRYIASPYRIAISQYELSWGDLTPFCKGNVCQGVDKQSEQPVFHLTEQLLEGYLDWLSIKTNYTYRLLTLDEWRVLADPLGLMDDLVLNHSLYPVPTCDDMGYMPQGQFLEGASVFQGSYDRYGIYNLKDLSPEIVVIGAKYHLVPGRLERLRRCRIEASAYEYPYAAYRLARTVADLEPAVGQ
jgi:hypothetical protein